MVSAIHLALLGGLLFSRSLLRWARREGYALPAAEDTVLDEVAGYAVAALGFYYQYAWGFALPFPLSLLFFPLSWIEWYIRWAVTSTASSETPAAPAIFFLIFWRIPLPSPKSFPT